MNAAVAAKALGCSEEQARAQMQRNLAGLEKMRQRAQETGRKVNGYTAEALEFMIAKIRRGWGL